MSPWQVELLCTRCTRCTHPLQPLLHPPPPHPRSAPPSAPPLQLRDDFDVRATRRAISIERFWELMGEHVDKLERLQQLLLTAKARTYAYAHMHMHMHMHMHNM